MTDLNRTPVEHLAIFLEIRFGSSPRLKSCKNGYLPTYIILWKIKEKEKEIHDSKTSLVLLRNQDAGDIFASTNRTFQESRLCQNHDKMRHSGPLVNWVAIGGVIVYFLEFLGNSFEFWTGM